MVGPRGVPLLDFGSTKVAGHPSPVLNAFGKGHYVAPEQREDAASVDARADIYPLGIMLFEMLTRRTFLKSLKTAFTWPDLPDEVARLISSSIVPIEQRIETVEEFRERLTCYVSSLAPSPAETEPVPEIAEPEPEPEPEPTEPIARKTPRPEPAAGSKKRRRKQRKVYWRRVAVLYGGIGFFVVAATLVLSNPAFLEWARRDEHRRHPAITAPSTKVAGKHAARTGSSAKSPTKWKITGNRAVLALPAGAPR